MKLSKKIIILIISCTSVFMPIQAHPIPAGHFSDEKVDKEISTFEFDDGETLDCHMHQGDAENAPTIVISIRSIDKDFIVSDDSLGIDNQLCSRYETDQFEGDIFIKCDNVTSLPGNIVFYQLGFPYGRVINPTIGPLGEFHCF